MPVEHDTSHQNGQEDTGGGGSNVSTETPSQQPQQAPEPIATTIVNGTHPKVPSTADDQGRQESPKDPKKTDGSASFLRAARAGNLEKVLEFLKTNTDINTCNANGLNALHLASKEGHVSVVTELLQRGANVDAATKKGNTALHIASLAGQEEIVKVLVQHQAMVNIQSQNGFTPLYMAAQENHDNVVRFLLANNANQSLATEDGFTPLAVALQQGHDKVVAVLLENDTRGKVRLPALHIAAKKDDTKAAALLLHTDHNPDVTSKSGFTPLHIAAHYGNENIANLLIQRGADVNYVAKHQITPLHVASKWGKGNMVSLLIDKGANYEAKTRDGLTPLHCAARSGHDTVVDMLLEKGAPITSKTKNGLAPLHMASQGDHVDAARILLYHKAPVDDVTVDFLTALHVAAHCGHVRVAKLLLDRKADPNARALNGFTPLHIACKKNRIKVVELLLKHGASIEATTESGLTPLHVASFMGCMNIVIYLIQHGASADVPTVRGETPLHLAARANQTDIIRILLRNGAQVDARAREQQTALHIASRLGNSDIVVLLLQHGAAVDATTKDHYTALHIAAKEGQEEVASVLLEHGASLTSTTKKGFTPLHLAAKYGNMKVARLLLQKDAPVDAQGKNGVTPLHVAAHYDHQNVALLLLDKGASPHATAKNGYTPLHIAARKNQMDIATTLLEYGASANAESKAGFTPLHLSSQEGHTDMATLLIEHNAAPGACAKNGLTPLHLCAQEDRVNVAAILVKHGAQIDPATKAGYTPLHVACHFGQMNMVRFLLQHGAKVESSTQLGYTPLHQAAQQGHTQIVNLLLENKAEPNAETKDGKTALSIAQRLGYISVVETLKIVTETTITTTTTTVTEEKYKVVVPETMHETFMSESEDEGGDDTMLGDQSYRYLTADEMKSLGDDSLPIDVTKDEKMDVSFISNTMAAPPVAPVDQLSPQHQKEQQYAQYTGHYPSDNVDIAKTPILAGPESLNTTLNTTIDSAMIESQIIPTQVANQLSAQVNQTQVQQPVGQSAKGQVPADQDSVPEKAAEILSGWEGFLVSFMVDARGGAMRGCRHSGVRVIIPPRKAAMPMRITCRYLKKDKLVHAPPLMEGEALGSRILEMGPAGAKFLGPVIIEVPHFASLRGKEREIVILRSDNGETWREHTLEATEEAVQEVLNESFDGEELKQLEDLNTNRITRILTTDFPQYFAIVTRIRQEVHAIGPEGGMVSSTVVPQVQAVFPQGALTKKIKVGLQAQPIPTDLVAKLLGNRVAVSPIVTVEPRRRKFHKPITLTIPVPQASSKGMINQYSGEAPTLRLLCSITGGTTRAQWEDVTGSTPLTFVNDCVSFTTTVSARFWLMDCSNIPEATKMATELYREAIHVPFMAKFVVFSKRHQLEEARVRVFCMTDDREDKTLEQQELFVEVAKSRDVEVLEGKPQYLEFAGNLVPVTKSGDQLAFNFYAFRENRLPFTVRVKDQHADPIGRVAFMRQPKVGRGDPPQTPICNLNIALPDNIQPEPAPSEPDLLALEKKYSFLSISKADTIHKADLRLTDISNMLGTDWVGLARELEISDSDINIIKSQYPDNAPKQAIVMLRLWMQTSGNKANGNTLEKGLRKIGRDDIVNQCIFNVELVTDDIERAMAKAHLDQSGFDAFRYELGPSRDTTLNRDVSLDVSYDEQDMMKEAESAEEEEENQRSYQDKTRREQHTADMSPTYESEEKKYAGEEKIVTEEKITKEEMKDGSAVTVTTTTTSVVAEPVTESKKEAKDKTIITEKVVPEDQKAPPAKEAEKVEDKVPKPEKKEEKPIVLDKAEEKVVEKVEEVVVEQKVEEKPVVKVVEKSAEVGEKAKDASEKLEEKAPEVPPASLDEAQKAGTTTATEVITGPDGTTTSSTTTTTERRSFTTADDGTVKEHIVIEKKTTSFVDGMEKGEDKSEILLKLGEELGRLDEQLEERFKEKRKAVEPEVAQEEVRETTVVAKRREGQAEPTSQVVVEHSHQPTNLSATITSTTTTTSITPTPDGFTQASVESRQMSSTGGTTEVSTKGTAITTTQPVIGDETVMQMGQALIQQRTSRPDSRRAAQDVLQWDTPLEDSAYKTRLEDGKEQVLSNDSTKAGQTEERGCSPITVLEARPEVDHVATRPRSRAGSHTITTTTSWGAPVTTTTSIEVDDDQSARCVQLTLHSESRVTLHAPGGVWEGLHGVEQQPEHQDEEQQPHEDKHVGDNDVPAEASPDAGPENKSEGETLTEQDFYDDIHQAKDAHELESKVQIKKSECSLSQGADAIVSTSVGEVSSNEAPTYDLIAKEKITEDIVLDSSKINEDIQLPSSTGAPDVQVDLSMDEVQMPILSSIKDSIPEGSAPETGSLPSPSKIRVSDEEIDIAHEDNALSGESIRSDKTLGDSAAVEIANKIMTESAQDVLESASQPLSDEDLESVSPSYDIKETECAIPALSGDDSAYLASEATAPSAHRPTTLMITSNSNESTDDAECTANDLTKLGREDDIPKELKEETSVTEMEDLEEQGMGELAVSERPPGSESGAVPRPERPARPAPRTTTLVKVKVEKRPITSHLLVRERSVHEHQPTVHVPSVEEEVRGLMQEVKEATSQIKQEVKELRQADTPTPDTPTPLREFKEFLNREEEQELERLPTIKEMCRESEEDASGTVGGEHLRGHEHLRLDLDVPTLGRPIPVQAVQRSGDDSSHPDSGYSTLEGYYAVGVDPYHTSKYKSCSEPVPEGSPSEPSIKSELESPSSLVDSSDLSPVDSVGSTTSPSSETQGKSKFKSFIKKVRKITSKGLQKSDNKKTGSQGSKSPDTITAVDVTIPKSFEAKKWETSTVVMSKGERLPSMDIVKESWASDISDQLLLKGRDYSPFYMEKIRKGTEESIETVADIHASEMPLEKSAVTDSPETDTAIIESPVSVASFSVSPIAEVHDITESHEVRMAINQGSRPDDYSPDLHEREVGSTAEPILSHDGTPQLSDVACKIGSAPKSQPSESSVESPSKDEPATDSLKCESLESSFKVPHFVEPFVIDSVISDCFQRAFESDTIRQDVQESELENISNKDELEAVPIDILTAKRERLQKSKTHSLEFEEVEPRKALPPTSPILLASGVENVRFEYEDDDEDDDDDVDLPCTDVVKILETVIELDEPEEEEDLGQDEQRYVRKDYVGLGKTRAIPREIDVIEEEPSQPLGQMISPELDFGSLLEQPDEVEDGDSVRSVIADSEFLSIEELIREKELETGGIDVDAQISEAEIVIDNDQMQVCVTEALIHSHEMQLSLVESVVEGDEMKLSVAESIVLSDDIQLSITETLADSDEMQLSVAEAVVDSDEMQQLSIAETVIDSDEMQLSVTETVVDSDDMQQSVSEAIVDNEDTQLYVSEAIVKNDDCKVFLERYDMRLDTEADVAGSDEIQILPEVEIAGEVGAMQVSSGSSAFTGMRQEDIDADLLKYECDRKKQRDSAWEKEKRSIRRRAFYKPPRVDDEENKTRTIMSTGETHYIYDPSIAEEPHHSESTSDLHSAIVEALSFRYFTDTIGKTEIEVRADESQVFESNVLDQGDPENQLTGLTLQEPDFARGTEIIHDYADMPTLPPDVIKVSETVCQVEEVEGMDRMCEVEEIVSPAVDLASGIETIHIGDYSEEFDKVVSIVTVTSSSESDSDQRVFLIDEVHNISEVESPEEDVTADIISDCLTEDMEAYATESDESMADMGIVEVSETVCLVDEIQEMFDLEKIGEIRPLEEEWRSGMEIIHQAEKSECFSAVSVKSVSEGPLSHTMTVDEYPSIKCNVELSTDKEMSSSTGAKAKVKDISKERITKTSGEVESTNVTHETESVKETKQCQEIMKPDCGLHGCESIKGELFEPSDRVNIQSSVEREKEKVPPDDSGGIEDNFTISIPEVGETDSWLNVIKAYQDQSTRAKQEYLEYDEYRKDESRTDDDVGDTVSETVVKTLHESSVCKVDCESFGNETGKRDLEEVHEDITRVEQAVESLGLRTTDSLLEQVSGSLSNERASEVEQPSDIVDEESLKLGVLDRVSEELKAMISNLEQNLAAGTSRNVRITPILARLEQLEQEVASLTPVSEPQESSIPNFSYAMQTHDLVSTPQASATEEKGRRFHAENLSSGNITSLAVNMPVGTQMETTTLGVPGGQSPIGEMNGQDIQDALTDVEDLNMDGESPIPKQKQLLLLPEKETGAVTDTEDMDLSGDENDIIPEKANLPTIQDLGVLPEPTKEVINLTEGYAREASPLLLSDSDSEREDVQNRHKKNIKKGEKMSELEVPGDDEPEGVTDVEDMVASGDEIEEQVQVEDSLPDHYLDQGEGVSNQEKMKAASPKPKVFKHHEDSSDDEKRSKKQVRRRSKASLTVQPKEDGTTDVEDLVFSDLGEKEEKVPLVKKEAKEKIKRKKQIRRKSFPRVQAGKNLSAPVGDTGGATDTEILTGDDDEDEYEEDDTNLGVAMYDTGAITDSEDVAASDTEDIADIVAAPLKKKESSIIPEPHAEKIRISETEEAPAKDSEGETDEEGFQLDDNEDEKPLVPRKRVVSEPIEKVVKEALEVEEPCEAALTDTEDFDLEDKEEEEVISDIASRIPTEGEIYTIKELESEYGQVTKKEIVKDADAELKELIREAEAGGLTLQEALNCEALTDVEDLDDDEPGKPKPKIAPSKKVQKDETATDEESVDESDIEEEIRKPPKRTRHRGKRLPLVPQVSEVRFVETDQGPLSIIITPDNLDNNPDQVVKDKVTGVVFLESEEKEEATTDVEELQSSDDEGQKRRASILNAPQLTTEPATDTEDFDVDAVEVDRPLSPLPPDLNYNVLSSPKREIIHIKEDKYGVPQVTIRKLQKDELLVSDVEDMAMTDTEDIEVSDAEALRLVGATTDSTAEFELPDTGKIEVSSTMKQKNQALHVDADEEGGSTDVEELQMTKKSKRKGKSRARLEPKGQGEDSHTDVELLSDQDDRSLTVRTESPRAHTDTEDFVTSETEDLGVPERDDAPTPDVIKNAAIKKVIILKEGPHGVTQTEEASVVQTHGLRVEDEPEGVTDIEDMEASGAEDDDIPEHPGVELPEQEHSSVDISEKTSIPKDKNEAKHIKDNLLLPEDNYNNLTDVESLDGGEGTHEATQIAEHQTTTVSQEQASSGLPTPGTKAGSDGVLHGGCPEAQGMDWEGKSVDSMYTETVVQARISMLPAVDTSEGVAPTSSPTTTLPCATPQPSTSPHTDLTFQTYDLTQRPPYSHLNLEPSHLHESHLVEPQSFDISPSSVTKLSDPLFLEKGFTSATEGLSKLVTSPSAASLQSESVAPYTGTDDMAAASVTYNTSSAVLSIGPVSPTEDSSEDHAEIDRTSTELSPDSVRFEQDMLETRTEDEAPDLDDDMMAGSPVLGPELSERVFSVEATEDTDITTPMEMRDSHTERDATASNLESVDDKEGTEGKSDLKDQCWDTEDNITCLAQETAEIHSRVIKLQEKVQAQEIDRTTAKSEAELILNTVADIREAVSNGKGESDEQKSKMAQDILDSISSISDTVAKIIQNLTPSDVETSSLLMKGETGVTKTESTVIEAGSPEEGSPSDSNIRDQTFSDLLDSDDINRESLEDEFEKLAAEMSLSPKAEEALVHKPEATMTTVPSDAITYPVSSSIIYPSKTPDALQATQREPAEDDTSRQHDVQLTMVSGVTHQAGGEAKLDELEEKGCFTSSPNRVSATHLAKSVESKSDEKDSELKHFNKPTDISEAEGIIDTFNTIGEASVDEASEDSIGDVVVRRASSRSGPRPTTFPLCLLQPEVVGSSPEAQQYFRQQQEVLEEMGRQGSLHMDVTDLRALTSPESLAGGNEFEDNEAEDSSRETRSNLRKLVKSSSSYENLYDGADLQAASSEDTPTTSQLTSSLGDPFSTKTHLPPEMCSSFENLYMKAREADEKLVHEANLLAGEILDEAVQEAVQEGVDSSTSLSPATLHASSGTHSQQVNDDSELQVCQHEDTIKSGTADVVQPDSGAGARQAPGVGVDEMSSVMESYTSDGSDPITTTHTTRIIRRTEVEDGEVKEDVYEEY